MADEAGGQATIVAPVRIARRALRPVKRLWRRARAATERALTATQYKKVPGGWPILLKRRGELVYENAISRPLADWYVAKALASIERPFVLLDVGANLGAYSLHAQRLPNCVAVLAFEPVVTTFSYLAANLRANRALKVRPFCVAIGEPGHVKLKTEQNHSGVAHFAPDGDVAAPVLGTAFLNEAMADWPGVNVALKIDVEGAEVAVLSQIERTEWFERVTDLVIEVKHHSQCPPGFIETLLGFIGKLGFERLSSDRFDIHFRRGSSNVARAALSSQRRQQRARPQPDLPNATSETFASE